VSLPTLLLAAGGFLDVLGAIVGVMLALAGLAVAFLGLVAMTEGVPRRGGAGLLIGLLVAALGGWLIGVW
jgi:hypothetical protein